MNRISSPSLTQWLEKIAAVHPEEIALGLDRVKAVFERMGMDQPHCPVIIVGGTNGKGSCVATLEKVYSAQGYRVGVFTSPIFWRHNEMVRLQGEEAADHLFCEAYARIEAARQEISLTPFEYHTLAAMDIFQRQALDLWILEVGLGGRLDAVNILDADVAVVTSIDIDHQAWLGDTRELIGREKAGIFRRQKPAVYGDGDPPQSLLTIAAELGLPLFRQGKDFAFAPGENAWSWRGPERAYSSLPYSQLALQNMSSALMAIDILQERLPVTELALSSALKTLSLPGRIEIISQPRRQILDVAHNPAAVAFLAERLTKIPRAVFSMLADKDIRGSLRAIKNKIAQWYVAPLAVKRGASEAQLRAAFEDEEISAVRFFPSIQESYQAALAETGEGEELLVFGSFHTVGEIKKRYCHASEGWHPED